MTQGLAVVRYRVIFFLFVVVVGTSISVRADMTILSSYLGNYDISDSQKASLPAWNTLQSTPVPYKTIIESARKYIHAKFPEDKWDLDNFGIAHLMWDGVDSWYYILSLQREIKRKNGQIERPHIRSPFSVVLLPDGTIVEPKEAKHRSLPSQ